MAETNSSYTMFLDVCTNANSNATCLDYYDERPDGGDVAFACMRYQYGTSNYYYSYNIGIYAEFNYFENQEKG
jgi:hypothetical protein